MTAEVNFEQICYKIEYTFKILSSNSISLKLIASFPSFLDVILDTKISEVSDQFK